MQLIFFEKYFIFFCFILCACSCKNACNKNIEDTAYVHEKKLRSHFLGDAKQDISSLISETKVISAQLKQAGLYRQANKFDSYIDVLTYGNKTIDESLNDVMYLIRQEKIQNCCNSSQ